MGPSFPLPLSAYGPAGPDATLFDVLRSRVDAQPFNLGGIIDGFGRRADTLAGNPRRALATAVDDFRDWWGRMQSGPQIEGRRQL